MTTISLRAFRLAIAVVLCLLLAPLSALQASAKPAFSSVAVDARNGTILFNQNADQLRHPASLTKMMTLYLLFQDLKSGRVRLSTPLRVSARAASMAPSKLGLRAGSTITVQEAIYALVIKSANDAAATVGENLGGGSESAFAARMTRTAQSLGMTRTVFRNSSGLPNPSQVTTARDMATLGLRLMRDFPQYYPYFRATSFNFRGRTIRTHNNLLIRFPGTDGIKTGYIAAAGYNLVTSTRRGDKRIVGVVLGARSSGARSAYMMNMLARSLPACRDGNTVAAVAGSSKGVANPIALASSKAVASPTPVERPATVDSETMAAAAADAATGPVVVDAEMAPQKKAVIEGDMKNASATDESSEDVASLPDDWAVQISTFSNRRDADAVIKSLKKSSAAAMEGKQAYTIPATKKGRTTYQLVIRGYSQQDAKRSCERVTATGMNCAVVRPNS